MTLILQSKYGSMSVMEATTYVRLNQDVSVCAFSKLEEYRSIYKIPVYQRPLSYFFLLVGETLRLSALFLE